MYNEHKLEKNWRLKPALRTRGPNPIDRTKPGLTKTDSTQSD